jgi:arginase family enzyme/ribosomal protein S18 acetylase RimI-like enzyme
LPQVTVVEVPQWQGSASPTAVRLVEGAAQLAALIPDAEHVRVAIGRTLAETARQTRDALSQAQGRFVVTVGGDCGVELEPIAAALRQHGDRLTVVWFDAHGDLNTPGSSPSGAFHGMVLRTLLGDGPPDLVPDRVLRSEQVVLAGVRALDPAQADFVREAGMGGLVDGAVLYIHVDLDVLDPKFFGSVGTPEPDGLLPDELVEQIAALAGRFEIVGLGITEYEPARPEDGDLLATLVPELVTLCSSSAARQIERRAALAWPAAVVENREGWLLRHSPGVRRKRSNSALPLTPGATGIDEVESFYRERRQRVCVQVTPAERHRSLDALLAARGYELTGRTLVLTAPTRDVIAVTASAIPVDTVSDLESHPDGETIARIASPVTSPAVILDGRTVGTGLFVADSGWAGVFCMDTRPEYRRRGVATAVLGAGARWAAEQGADRLYLQVEDDNDVALRLYEKLGFTPSHTYHYRIQQ